MTPKCGRIDVKYANCSYYILIHENLHWSGQMDAWPNPANNAIAHPCGFTSTLSQEHSSVFSTSSPQKQATSSCMMKHQHRPIIIKPRNLFPSIVAIRHIPRCVPGGGRTTGRCGAHARSLTSQSVPSCNKLPKLFPVRAGFTRGVPFRQPYNLAWPADSCFCFKYCCACRCICV